MARLLVALLLASALLTACRSTEAQSSDPESAPAVNAPVPAVFDNIKQDERGRYYLDAPEGRVYEINPAPQFTLEASKGNPRGTATGLQFDFEDPEFTGRLYYGFIPYGDSRHPLPVYFKRSSLIEAGKAELPIIDNLDSKYDMVGWTKTGRGILGYRLVSDSGLLIYDGIVGFRGKGPFSVDLTLIEGPLVHQPTPDGAVVSFTLNRAATASVEVDGRTYGSGAESRTHEIALSGLDPDTEYSYTVRYGEDLAQTYSFRTAPETGTRSKFTFAYASDSRNGQGGGERNLYGTNYYIVKKIAALAHQREARFMQFSGDLVDGYLNDPREIDLQYANWKRAMQPWGHYLPFFISMGNHEALSRTFPYPADARYPLTVDRWPFETESAEAVFARNFVNPSNGPETEDGAAYDPNPNQIDFPPYRENVFSYTYDNVGVVVLNSDYLYTPNASAIPLVGGGLHGYIWDGQLAWLEETLDAFEQNDAIDHVFITLHTPFFPNGGHREDDMWYDGENKFRPAIAGRPLPVGIIQRRDQLLEQIVNAHEKPVAILTGDEHNFAITNLKEDTPIYPDDWAFPRWSPKRTLYQINNGAAGAPYYAQQQTPWSDFVEGFTTQNALVLVHVDGESVEIEVVNPDTLEEIMRKKLRD